MKKLQTVVNLRGLWTLFRKEILRFAKVWMQTIINPLISTSLYFLVFGVALGSRLKTIDGVPYIEFVIPGLIMLSMITASFSNCASSLFQSKINGTIIDLLVAPIGALEILVAYVAAAMVRAFLVGRLVFGVAFIFTGTEISHLLWCLLFAGGVSAFFSLLDILLAVWAEKFDHLALLPNFVLTPLTFLGGVFYSVDMLPSPWDSISRFNPILYMINGMRYGLLGISDVPVGLSGAALTLLLIVLTLITHRVLSVGYKLRT